MINSMMLTENLLDWQQRMGYLLIDHDLYIGQYNAVLKKWLDVDDNDLQNQKLTDLFPELYGIEDSFWGTEQNIGDVIEIARTNRLTEDGRDCYFDIQIEVIDHTHFRYFVTVLDVTKQALQEQRMRQQWNELQLVSSKLQGANEQLAYLLKRFVPERVANNLIANRQMPTPGGEQRAEATVLFADMRHFTAIAEALSPEETLDILNVYLEVLAESIHKYNGSVIQIVGDMIMATFNVPEEQEDHALRAVYTALDIQKQLAQFTRANAAEIPPAEFGIGIHTGEVIGGYLGVKNRYRYAVVSDTTNVAFHLCSKAAGGQIIISQATLNLLGNALSVEPLDSVILKNRKQSLPIYELQGLKQTFIP